jgi:hydrogenase nickel incorporation protein HypB
MCETCGCGDDHDHHHEHGHHHEHHHDHDHHHDHPERKVIEVKKDILSENNMLAGRNRGFFEGRDVIALNMVSSPGSGKTAILERTIEALSKEIKIFVIEGDQQTTRDSDRIKKAGAPAVQVNTGTGCHLDARMVAEGAKKLELTPHSILFIENVGNLVCPALFDLGEQIRVVVISVTEGDDKPLKYPYMFESAQLCIINKTDLLPYVDFNMDIVKENARKINHSLQFIEMSAKTGEGLSVWTDRLKAML